MSTCMNDTRGSKKIFETSGYSLILSENISLSLTVLSKALHTLRLTIQSTWDNPRSIYQSEKLLSLPLLGGFNRILSLEQVGISMTKDVSICMTPEIISCSLFIVVKFRRRECFMHSPLASSLTGTNRARVGRPLIANLLSTRKH